MSDADAMRPSQSKGLDLVLVRSMIVGASPSYCQQPFPKHAINRAKALDTWSCSTSNTRLVRVRQSFPHDSAGVFPLLPGPPRRQGQCELALSCMIDVGWLDAS